MTRRTNSLVAHKADVGTVAGGTAGAGLEALRWLLSAASKAAVGLPVAAGLGGGYLLSRMTSPTEADMRLLEAKMINAKVKTMRDQNRRRLEAEARALKDDRA